MVSSANVKLRKIEQEMEALKQKLEAERKAHEQTKRQLDTFNKIKKSE